MTVTNFITAAILAASLTTPANAEGYTGNSLLDNCKAYERVTDTAGTTNATQAGNASACHAYIIGMLEGVIYTTPYIPDYCLPDRIKYKQIIRVVTKYLDDHPEKLHLGAATLVDKAMQDAFPCKGGKS